MLGIMEFGAVSTSTDHTGYAHYQEPESKDTSKCPNRTTSRKEETYTDHTRTGSVGLHGKAGSNRGPCNTAPTGSVREGAEGLGNEGGGEF